MADAETTAAPGAVDDTTNNEATPGQVVPETGGVTQDEINAALGKQYQTVAPVADGDTDSEDEPATDDTTDDVAADDPEEADDDTEEEPTPAPAKAVTTPDVPKDETDFSFTFEDANGVTYKLAPGDDIEKALKDFEPANNGQIVAILDQLRDAREAQKMYQADQQKEADQAATSERVAKIQEGWTAEVKELQAQGRLPKTVKGTDNQRVQEVYKFMAEENDRRIAAGRPTLNSFEDALDKKEAVEARDAKTAADTAAKETARKNGALVGGGSATASGGSPVYRAGSARNSNEAIRALGLL